MNFKTLRNRLSIVALISSGVLFLFSLIIYYSFSASKFIIVTFGIFFFITLLSAFISLPKWKSLVGLSLLVVAVFLSINGRGLAQYHSTVQSPDARHKIVVYRVPMLVAMPGQGSDAPCYIQLQTKSGKILNEGYMEMILLMDPIEWNKDSVSIGRGDGSYDWKLSE